MNALRSDERGAMNVTSATGSTHRNKPRRDMCTALFGLGSARHPFLVIPTQAFLLVRQGARAGGTIRQQSIYPVGPKEVV